MMRRTQLEAWAARAKLEGAPLLGDRELRLKLLALVAPEFARAGRTDDALDAALDLAMDEAAIVRAQLAQLEERRRTAWESSSPTTSSTKPTERRGDALTVDERLAQLERARQDAWKPRAPTTTSSTTPRRTDETEVDRKLADLEAQRQSAWMPRPSA